MKDNRKAFTIMAVIAVLMGLYLVFVAPGFFDTTMEKLMLRSYKPDKEFVLSAGMLSRLYIGSIYSGIEMLVGLALIGISAALYKGKKWAWPVAMLLLSLPAMVNGFIGLGWLENLKKYPPAYNTFFLALIAFLVMFFLKKNEKKTKNAMFWVLLLLGLLGAQGFMLFPHALRVILGNPTNSLLDSTANVLLRTGPLMFLVFIFAGLAILKIAQRKESGWYMALLTGLMMAFGAFPAHYARPLVASLVPGDTLAPSIFTSTYWMAGAQGVILVVLLLLPFFKKGLLPAQEE